MLKFIIFIVFPLFELLWVIVASQLWGGWAVASLMVFLMMVGAWKLKDLGSKSIQRMASQIKMGQRLSEDMQHAALQLFAAILLLFPGLISGVLGLTLLMPFVRVRIAASLRGKGLMFFESAVKEGRVVKVSDIQQSAND